MTIEHIVTVTFKPRPEHLDAFTGAMRTVRDELPSVDGCKAVRVMTHQDDPSVFMLVEDWENSDKHAAHINRLVETGEWAGLEQMLSVPPTSIVLTQV